MTLGLVGVSIAMLLGYSSTLKDAASVAVEPVDRPMPSVPGQSDIHIVP